MNRNEAISRLKQEKFDLCIIGAGASGAGCALDAALRGLKVALIDKTDFAAETSSKSTKLVHGGVRYLEQAFKNLDFGQLRQVRHGLEERHLVLGNAPHLAHPLGLITPVFSWIEGLYFTIGLRLYGWFASSKDGLPKSQWLSKSEALLRMPGLSKRIHSAVLYYDGQLDDARYCVALAQTAARAGAAVSNHLRLMGFNKNSNGKLESAIVQDELKTDSFQIRANVFLNCTGAMSDGIRQMANPELPQRIKPSKGVHASFPWQTLGGHDAMLIPQTRDGRVVFAVPFEGELIVGTTDDAYSDLSKEPNINAKEIDFLLETLNRFVDKPVQANQLKAGFGGLRPLITGAKSGQSTKTLLRDHEVEIDAKSGLMSLLGGKWTTYRLMAQDTIDALCRRLGIQAKCHTKQHLLYGGEGFASDLANQIRQKTDVDAIQARHLSEKYGSNAWKIVELMLQIPNLSDRIHPDHPYMKAEVVYAAREEMACTPRDFLARRIRLEISDWKATLQSVEVVVELMGAELGWTTEEQQAQRDNYKSKIEFFQKSAQHEA